MLDPTSLILDPIVLWSLSQQDGEHGDDEEQSTEKHFESSSEYQNLD